MGSPPTPRARRALAAFLVALVISTVVAVPARAAAAPADPVVYHPPVDGPVVDGFRPPATPYGAGNRGIDYATEPGAPVVAAAGGEVVFAGPVAGDLHVVVLHPDGIRTSYSFLASISVRRGQQVDAGATVGTAGGVLHFGARAGETYLDPTLLFAGDGSTLVRLVPEHARRPGSVAEERDGLVEGLVGWLGNGARTVVGWGAGAGEWVAEAAVAGGEAAVGLAIDGIDAARRAALLQLRARLRRMQMTVHYLWALNPIVSAARLALETWRWQASQAGCTPAGEPPPPPPDERRILVLVAGFGSQGGSAGVLRIDTEALGYDDADIAQFSYRGGRVPGVGAMTGVPVNDYEQPDSQQDIPAAAERLRDLLAAIRAAHPGVPVDIIAHSQGGLVTRAALGAGAVLGDPRMPDVDHVVTLATPHTGANIATMGDTFRTTAAGTTLFTGAAELSSLDPLSPAADQLSETSDVVDGLGPAPGGADPPDFTSIGARGDMVVPAPRTQLDGATNVIVEGQGINAHDALPGSEVAAREIALALADRGPTCRPLAEIARDAYQAHRIGMWEDLAAAVGTAGLSVPGG